MKSYIMNFMAVILLQGCGVSRSSPAYKGSTIVFSQQGKLKALVAGKKEAVVLREKFITGSSNWCMLSNGEQLTFCAAPGDVDFFNAGAVRDYLFLVAPNSKARVLLAGYGPKVASGGDYNFESSSFDPTGKKVLAQEGLIGQFMDDSSAKWIAIYDIKTRKRLFDSRALIEKMSTGATRKSLSSLKLSTPVLSPDGNDIVCFGLPDDGDSIAETYTPGQKVPAFVIIHFGLKRRTAQTLTSIDDYLAFGRTTYSKTETENRTTYTTAVGAASRPFYPQFAWHPTQKSFVFSGPTAPDMPGRNLFRFDLAAKKLTRLTSGTQDDFSPQWAPDGKSLYWLRGSEEKAQIYVGDSNAKNARLVMPELKEIDRIQIVSRLGNWNRYRKIPVEALAGKDR